MTDLDPLQSQAVDLALDRVRKGGAFKLLGKAGTGKTTTGKAIVQRLIEAGYDVICCAFTNKAVIRMKEVGYPAQKCRTVNRLLYTTGIQIKAGDYIFSVEQADKILRSNTKTEEGANRVYEIFDKVGVPKERWDFVIDQINKGRGERVSGIALRTDEQLAKEGITRKTVIVVDEISMLPIDAADELHGMFDAVIYIGDPGQLPPVNSVDTCKYLSTDDTVELKTVHRVQGNDHLLDIIYTLDAGKLPASTQAIDQGQFDAMVKGGYQFICYTNNGVAWMNERCRRVLGRHGNMPEIDEPLITVVQTRASRVVQIDDENRSWFLRNEGRLSSQYTHSRGKAGAVYDWQDGKLLAVMLFRSIQKSMVLRVAGVSFAEDGGAQFNVPVIVDGDPDRIWMVRTEPFWSMTQGRKRAFRKVGNSMRLDFAYAITAHKAQGSEWPKVAVMVRQIYKKDAADAELREEVSRWNYTAATRGRQDIQLFSSIIGCPYG